MSCSHTSGSQQFPFSLLLQPWQVSHPAETSGHRCCGGHKIAQKCQKSYVTPELLTSMSVMLTAHPHSVCCAGRSWSYSTEINKLESHGLVSLKTFLCRVEGSKGSCSAGMSRHPCALQVGMGREVRSRQTASRNSWQNMMSSRLLGCWPKSIQKYQNPAISQAVSSKKKKKKGNSWAMSLFSKGIQVLLAMFGRPPWIETETTPVCCLANSHELNSVSFYLNICLKTDSEMYSQMD